MTTTTRTELPVVQSGSSCCSTVPTQAAAPVVETTPADQPAQRSSCCSPIG